MSHTGVFRTRGTQSGAEINVGSVVGRPIDIEIVNGKLEYTTTVGKVYESVGETSTLVELADNGGAVLKEVVDMEPLLNADGTMAGYLLLDRWGNIHAYGSAVHQGNAKFEQEVSFGAKKSKVVLPLAVDLEVVSDPANPSVNLGYYILSSDGTLVYLYNVGTTYLTKVDGTSQDLGAVALNVDAGGDYQVLLQNGMVVFWSNALNHYTLSSPLYTQPNHPLVVDFTKAGNTIFLLDEYGAVFPSLPDAVGNTPAQFEGLIGKLGFFDIEAGFLTE